MLKLKINSMAKQQDGSQAVQVVVYDPSEPKVTLASFTQKIEKIYDRKELKTKLKNKIKQWKDTEIQSSTKDDVQIIITEIEKELF